MPLVPTEWPTGVYDRPAVEFFRARLVEHPESFDWLGRYALHRSAQDARSMLVRAGGFFGPPNDQGVIEVGYSVVTAFRGRGFATEMIRGLAQHAFSTGKVSQMVTHTRPDNIPSVRVLERSGFSPAGPGEETGTVRYLLLNPAS